MLQRPWRSVLEQAFIGLTLVVLVFQMAAHPVQAAPNQGLAAMDRAAKANRYLYIFFHNQDDAQTQALGAVFNNAVASTGGRADSIAILVTDPSEAGIVSKFGVKNAPMPLAVVVAPNGAVTASFPGNFTVQQLVGALASPAMEKTLGSLQQGKLVFLCIQNGRTRWNAEAMSGVRAFKADQRYTAATDVIMIDPSLPLERGFLAKLSINADVDEAMTLFLAPPGSIIGNFRGATNKEQLIATLTKAMAGCGPGAGPGCCGVK